VSVLKHCLRPRILYDHEIDRVSEIQRCIELHKNEIIKYVIISMSRKQKKETLYIYIRCKSEWAHQIKLVVFKRTSCIGARILYRQTNETPNITTRHCKDEYTCYIYLVVLKKNWIEMCYCIVLQAKSKHHY
jgi:hypothetical protein